MWSDIVRGRIYHIWYKMKRRCQDITDKDYKNYGGRGICVCDEWQEFESFFNWAIENGHEENLQIERLNNSGNYEPDNCIWATSKEQANNKRGNNCITYNGETKTITMWAEEIGMSKNALWNRIMLYGWPVDKALTTPCGKRRIIEYNGVSKRLYEWAKYLDINYDVLDTRINQRGWTIERAFMQPVKIRG